jgi:hypothetical protein
MVRSQADVDLDMKPYKNTGTYILSAPDEAMQMLDDHIVMTQVGDGRDLARLVGWLLWARWRSSIALVLVRSGAPTVPLPS